MIKKRCVCNQPTGIDDLNLTIQDGRIRKRYILVCRFCNHVSYIVFTDQ